MLTPKRHRFVAEYLVDLNATQAAISAGYSEKTAKEQGSRLLTNVNVAEAIRKGQEKKLAKLEITAERVLNEIAKLAFVDPRKFFNQDGSLKRIEELDDETAAALSGFAVFEEFQGQGEDRKFVGYTKKIKLIDKGQNLERLGRHLKLFTDRVESSGPNGGAIAVSVNAEEMSLADLAAEIRQERSKKDGDAS